MRNKGGEIQPFFNGGVEMWKKEFWLDTAERTIFTFAEIMLGFLTADKILSPVEWKNALITAGVSAVATVLKCIVVQAVIDGKEKINEVKND